MQICVTLYGALRRYSSAPDGAKHRPFTVEMQRGASVELLLLKLQISDALVSAIAVNGEHVLPNVALQDGDNVTVFPPAAGG